MHLETFKEEIVIRRVAFKWLAQVMRQVCGVDFEEARKGLELAGLSLPLVLKPVQSSGTDGVKLCRSWHEVKEHFHELRCTKSRVSAPSLRLRPHRCF